MKQINLDQKAAQYAQAIVRNGGAEIENLVTKALGVLQEQGVYACILFLLANKDQRILSPLCALLNELPVFQANPDIPTERTDSKATLKFYSDTVCNDLDTLLLVKDLYEQTLIYARYGAKAAGKE
jgi:hypothetical protein